MQVFHQLTKNLQNSTKIGWKYEFQKTRSKGASLLKWFHPVKVARHYLLDIPDVGRNHILLFFPLKIISVREIYSDSLFNIHPCCVVDPVHFYTVPDPWSLIRKNKSGSSLDTTYIKSKHFNYLFLIRFK